MRFSYILLVFFIFTAGAYSQWSTDPSENTRVTNGGLLPEIISDGTGGAYIVYQDSPALLRQVWVQWLDKFGYVRFPDNGVRVSSEESSQSPYYFLVSDSAGGVIVVFENFQVMNDVTLGAVYAQRIDSTGTKLWGDAGVEITPPRHSRRPVSACSDSESGVFVFYDDGVDSTEVPELRAQRVSANGQLLLPGNGMLITDEFTSANVAFPNPAVSDGLGNAIILYSDSSGTKLQKVSEQGEFLWGEGVGIFPVGREMIGDSFGGAIVAGVRRESNETGLKYVVGAQRIDANGQVLWGEKGTTIEDSVSNQTLLYFSQDYSGGGIFGITTLWRDIGLIRTSKRIRHDGRVDWGKNGIGGPVVTDLEGNSIFLSTRRVNEDTTEFLAQRVDILGNQIWTSDIVYSTRDAGTLVVSDSSGGVIVCWAEIGVNTGMGIFAQQVSRNGKLGEVLVTAVSPPDELPLPTQFALHQSYPNPFNAETIIKYGIPESSRVIIAIYDITGKEVITLINKNQAPGAYQVNWNGKNQKGGDVASGIYFYQLRAGNLVQTRKALLIK